MIGRCCKGGVRLCSSGIGGVRRTGLDWVRKTVGGRLAGLHIQIHTQTWIYIYPYEYIFTCLFEYMHYLQIHVSRC